jgi:RecA/RadA recombinase
MLEKNKVEKKEMRFRTGSCLLDVLVGGGAGLGYPAGKIINIVGDKSSGKTFLACELLAAAYHRFNKKLKWVYDDCESGFGFDTQKLYGFDIMTEGVKKSSTVEDLYSNIRNFLESLKTDSGEIGVYVVDSLDGLTSEEGEARGDARYKAFIEGKEFKKGSYQMGKAKFLSQEFFPGIAGLIEEKKALLVVISQVRENIDPMSFEKYVRAGGKAMDFYCHTVLWLANINKIKRKDRAVGIVIKAKLTKSKTPRPYRDILVSTLFDYGVDDIGSSVDFLFEYRTETGLLSKEKMAVWSGSELNVENIKSFLEKNKLLETYQSECSKNIKRAEAVRWLLSKPELKEKYETTFGRPMLRDEMISFIESHNLANELAERVVSKWEMTESSVKTNRMPKYAIK